MSANVNIIQIPLSDFAATDTFPLFQAPSDAVGGGITIVDAKAVNGAATAGGTSFTLTLLKYSSAGTPAVNGTITDTLGGSADEWADLVPKPFTISSGFVDADEWVYLAYAEENNGVPTRGSITIKYLMGK
jgi:hypothetical protein